MYITKEKVKEITGYDMDGVTLAGAQMMIEAWTGRVEDEVEDAHDREILARATAFQAVYVKGHAMDALTQMAVKTQTMGESMYVMNTDQAAPFMSFWAVQACKALSWMGTRSVHTGPIWDKTPVAPRWETD